MRVPAALIALALLMSACGGADRAALPCGERPPGAAEQLVYSVEGGTSARSMARRACERLVELSPGPVRVRPLGDDRISVVAAAAADARSALEGSSVRFYDWDARVLGPRGPDAPFVGASAFFDAVELASSGSAPVARGLSDRFYLFGADRRVISGPAESRERLGDVPSGGRVMRVPAGVAVVEDARGEGPPGRYFVIEDKPALTGDHVGGVRAEPDRVTGDPVLILDFRPRGRRAFRQLTATVAGGTGRFAVVVDERLISLPAIDPALSPDGIDPPSAQLGPVGSAADTRRVARRLASAPLAERLRLVSVRGL